MYYLTRTTSFVHLALDGKYSMCPLSIYPSVIYVVPIRRRDIARQMRDILFEFFTCIIYFYIPLPKNFLVVITDFTHFFIKNNRYNIPHLYDSTVICIPDEMLFIDSTLCNFTSYRFIISINLLHSMSSFNIKINTSMIHTISCQNGKTNDYQL